MRTVLAVDVGGTKIALAAVDDAGHISARERVATPAEPRAAVALIAEVAARWRARGSIDPHHVDVDVGVGCPGPLDIASGTVSTPPNLPGWHGFALVDELERALGGGARVTLENDANAAALGEHRFGAARGVDDVVYLTISTGIGAGAIVDGRIVHGANGNAAELGHLTVKYDGWPCPCGNRGCIEAFASGPSLVRRARERGLDVDGAGEGGGAAGDGDDPRGGAARVLDLVRAGDAAAVALWDETVEVLAAGVANAINAFNPKLVVVGGGLALGAGALLMDPLKKLARARAMKPLADVVDVVPAALGADAGLLGAAAVAFAARAARNGAPG